MRSLVAACLVGAIVGAVISVGSPSRADPRKEEGMELGNFSVSLAVKDLSASRAFYEKLGFKKVMGDAKQNWLILQNGASTIGLFQGMFERNTLTFNPGWNGDGKALEKFQDVRDIQRVLKERGLRPTIEADEASKGPASLLVTDPDGNPVLIDQHVAKPAK